MKKKVLLLTALASITLASVATVAAVSKSEFRDVRATDYTIKLDSTSTFNFEEDSEWDDFYYCSLVGKTGSGKYDFGTVDKEGENYLGSASTPTTGSGYIFGVTGGAYAGSAYFMLSFELFGVSVVTQASATLIRGTTEETTHLTSYSVEGGFGYFLSASTTAGGQILKLKEIIFEYTC